MAKRRRARETFECPVCGADVVVGSPGCRECGSTAETGWSEENETESFALPSIDEDDGTAEPRRYPLWAIITAAILVIVSVVLAISL